MGGKTVSELLDSISSREFQEWKAYLILKAKKEKDAQPSSNSGKENLPQTF